MSKRKTQADTADTDNSAWTAKDFAKARLAQEFLPKLFSQLHTAALLAPHGRPKTEVTKVPAGAHVDMPRRVG